MKSWSNLLENNLSMDPDNATAGSSRRRERELDSKIYPVEFEYGQQCRRRGRWRLGRHCYSPYISRADNDNGTIGINIYFRFRFSFCTKALRQLFHLPFNKSIRSYLGISEIMKKLLLIQWEARQGVCWHSFTSIGSFGLLWGKNASRPLKFAG